MKTEVNRRNFFRSVGAATAAVTVMSPRTAFGTAANSTVQLGIIGCGGRGTGVISSMARNTGSRIAAIADIFGDQLATGHSKLDKVNRELGHAPIDKTRLFRGSKAYLRLLDMKDIDAVLVSTPAFLHPGHLEAAIDAGKHVYCEKPVAVDPAGARQVRRAGRKARGNVSLAVGFQIRHATPYRGMVERIRRGDIGEIVTVQAYYFAGAIPLSWREDVPPDEARLRAWFWDRALSGDILVEQGVHVVDICNWALGAHPLRASGSGGRKGRRDRGDVWSHYTVNFRYPEDVHVSFHSTQFDPGYGDVCVRFFGTEGIAEAHYTGGVFIKGRNAWDSGVARGTVETISKEQWASGTFKSSLEDADPNKQKAFIESIKSGSPINEADTGADTALAAILGRTAAYLGREVAWEEVANSDDRLDPGLDLTWFDK